MPPRLHLFEAGGPVVCLACGRLGADPYTGTPDTDPWTNDVNTWLDAPYGGHGELERCCEGLNRPPQALLLNFDTFRR